MVNVRDRPFTVMLVIPFLIFARKKKYSLSKWDTEKKKKLMLMHRMQNEILRLDTKLILFFSLILMATPWRSMSILFNTVVKFYIFAEMSKNWFLIMRLNTFFKTPVENWKIIFNFRFSLSNHNLFFCIKLKERRENGPIENEFWGDIELVWGGFDELINFVSA